MNELKAAFNARLSKINLHSLQIKMFILCMIITNAIVFLNVWIITQRAENIIADNAYSYIYESMRHSDSNFDIFLEDALSLSVAIASNKGIISALQDHSSPASFAAFSLQMQADEHLKNLVSNKTHILQVAAISIDGKSYKSSGDLILRSVVSEDWFTETRREGKMRVFYNSPNTKRIALCRPITYNNTQLGVALVEMDYDLLGSVYAIKPLQNAKITTFTEDGSLVFANYDLQESTIPMNDLLALIDRYDENETRYSINDTEILAVKHTSDLSGLTTIGLIAYNDLLTEALDLHIISITIITLSIIVSTMAAWFAARYISKNINKLQSSMIQISNGDIASRVNITSQDEIGNMANIFNKMMDRIAYLVESIKKTEALKRKAEQDALEAQIQPHFIYNTINSISYMAHMRGQTDIEEVSIATVELLRGVLGVRESFVPLWQECEYIKQYIKVQKFKMQNDFTVIWDVEPEIWLYRIPKLLLQPIFENALIHGIADKKGGQISIQAAIYDGKLTIRVTDNGKGITKGKLDMLNKSDTTYSQLRSVGFANVKERIKAIYGEGYDVYANSIENAFTSVEIVLPYSKQNDEYSNTDNPTCD